MKRLMMAVGVAVAAVQLGLAAEKHLSTGLAREEFDTYYRKVVGKAPAFPVRIGTLDAMADVPADVRRKLAAMGPYESSWTAFRDGTLWFVGKEETAELYAVYHFLEEKLGVRWLKAPIEGDDGEYIPGQDGEKTGTWERGGTEAFEDYREPDYVSRSLSATGVYQDRIPEKGMSTAVRNGFSIHPMYTISLTSRDKVKNKRHWDFFRPRVNQRIASAGGGHCLFSEPLGKVFGSRDKAFAAHPEYFGYDATTKKRVGETLCLTAPGLVDLAVRKYLARFEESEADGQPVEAFLLGMRDSWTCCQCETCAAPITLPDGRKVGPNDGEVHASTRYWTFVRDVCTKLREKHPEIRYYGWGYHYGRTPPACELPKWLHCELDMDGDYKGIPYLDPRQDRTVRDRILKWNELLPGHVSYLESWFISIDSVSGGVPPVKGVGEIPCWQRNLRDMAHVLKGAGAQTYTCPDASRSVGGKYPISIEWDACPAARWLTTRLLWNPDQDLAALKKFYYTRTYREAADLMEEFTEGVDRGTDKGTLEDLLRRAVAKAEHPNAKAMIRRQLDHWLLLNKGK